jgi:hypothetical protein
MAGVAARIRPAAAVAGLSYQERAAYLRKLLPGPG